MKNILKITSIALIITMMAGVVTSCKKNKKDPEPQVTLGFNILKSYQLKLDEATLTSADIRAINGYFAVAGIDSLGSNVKITVTGATEEECNKKVHEKAKADWEKTWKQRSAVLIF